jgi:hypothetical protein
MEELGDLSLDDDVARFARLSRAVRADLLEIADVCFRDQVAVNCALQIARESLVNQDAVLAFARSSQEEQGLRDDVEKLGRLQQLRVLDTAKLVNARAIAQEFVDILMNDSMHEEIPNSDGMTYVRDIPKLEDHTRGPMIVRKITVPFWRACIQTLNLRGIGKVAAVGTPGIGMTSCTPMLIRTLLQEGSTVVYHVVKETNPGWLYEFTSRTDGEGYRAQVYPDRMGVDGVPCLALSTTYYIVDPGMTKTKCQPCPPFKPKVVVVASPDSRHWGESAFRKGVAGIFMYFPVWSKSELWSCNGILGRKMSENCFNERYRLFGGVPRHVFASQGCALQWLARQNHALNELTPDEVKQIGTDKLNALNSFSTGQLRSTLLGYVLSSEDNGTFRKTRVVCYPRKLWRNYGQLIMDCFGVC